MRRTTLRAGLLLAALFPLPALAQDGFPGQYELEGRTSTRRKTEVQLVVTRTPGGGTVVERTARFTSRTYAHLPAFTWTSSRARIEGRRMQVTYVLEPAGGVEGLVDRLDPDRASTRDVLSALDQRNVISAVYFLSADGREIRETALNTTRLGAESWWRFVTAKGERKAAPSTPGLNEGEFVRRAEEVAKGWYLEWIRDSYEDRLAEATSEEERRRIREDRATDMNWDNVEVDYDADSDWWTWALERYDDGDPYLDAHGRPVPREAVRLVGLSMFPELAGIGLTKVFIFDRRTGDVLDASDIND